jgi:phospholipid N-methyltransferase
MEFAIVYYIYINEKRDWKTIVKGQIDDLLFVNLKPKNMYICICSKKNYIEEVSKFCESFNPVVSWSQENNFEYPGIHKLWEIRKKYKFIFYMHSKGMVYSDSAFRSNSEKITLRGTIYNYRETLKLFENSGIDKVGLWPSVYGEIFVNFFWIRSSAIPDLEPVKTKYRFYYESYIKSTEIGYLNCWSLILNRIGYSDFNRCDIKNKKLQIINYIFEGMMFYYGSRETRINVTNLVFEKCLKNGVIFIPCGDISRAMIFGDPLPGIVKSFFVGEREFKYYSNIYILNEEVYQIDDLPKHIIKNPINVLSDIHNKIKLIGGSKTDEYPEQLMAVNYIKSSSKVLEIGANIGRNTLVIASILSDSRNLTALECDPDSFNILIENIQANNFQVKAINAALSKKQLIQKGWDTIISDTVLPGFKRVNTINYLEDTFDTLVLDCEGAFYYILQDFPEILEGIRTIIMENDYWDINHKNYIDSVLFQNGFWVDYSADGGWGPCKDFFYQVFTRS